MRVGSNPARQKQSPYTPAEVTMVLLTYIPDLSGYFQQRLDILKVVLQSIVRHTRVPHDLLVFDNASCPEAQAYLREAYASGQIDYLVLSQRNVGKIGALQLAFAMAPGKYIAYSDDDILFYPGWLQAHLQVLKTFPQVGMVSGVPVRNAGFHAHATIDAWLKNAPPGVDICRERVIPDDWEVDWAVSTGRDPQKHLADTKNVQDVLLSKDGVLAIGHANHFQFVAPKDVLLRAMPSGWTGKLMGHMIELDEAIDAQGYVRLSTVERYTRHIGNVLSPALLAELQQMGLHPDAPLPLRITRRHWLTRIPGMRRIIKAVYDRLFYILHPVR